MQLLGVIDWDPRESYDRADRLFNRLSDALQHGWDANIDGKMVHIDSHWFANRLAIPSQAGLPTKSRSLAVDGTDVETWGALRGELMPEDVDVVTDEDQLEGDATKAKPRRRRRARVLSTGADGRKIYTVDAEARAGHRSGTFSRTDLYVGYELHLGVQTRDVTWSDGIEQVSLGPSVPKVVSAVALVPAGSHRGDAIVPTLIEAKKSGLDLDDVVWDRGYSQSRPETAAHPLNRAGIHQTFRPMARQRATKPFTTDALLIEGQLFSAQVPPELRETLTMPPDGASEEEKLTYEQPFNQRARYRYQRHAGPDADGTTRWRCPFDSGFLRSRALPKTMRGSRKSPLVELPEGAPCCGGTVSVSAAELPFWQRLVPGTTAWRISMGRRQVVEGANSGLKGGFVNIERKFMRVMGLTKMTVMLAFTIAGYNIETIRPFLAKFAQEQLQKPKRAKRRTGTWQDLLAIAPSPSGPDPP